MSERNYLIQIGESIYLTVDGTETGTRCFTEIPGIVNFQFAKKRRVFTDFRDQTKTLITTRQTTPLVIRAYGIPFSVFEDLIDLINAMDAGESTGVEISITDAFSPLTVEGEIIWEEEPLDYGEFSKDDFIDCELRLRVKI